MVNLIKIDQWDFRWHTLYQFKLMLHLPKGSVILAEATYDNTAENPSRPPRDVGYGWNITKEMDDETGDVLGTVQAGRREGADGEARGKEVNGPLSLMLRLITKAKLPQKVI